MGYWQKIGQLAAAFAMAGGTSAAAAAPEPLTLIQLGDPESELQPAIVVSGDADFPTSPASIDDFSRAISEAVRVQQQSIEAKCRSSSRGSSSIAAARWAWEANCRYRRY